MLLTPCPLPHQIYGCKKKKKKPTTNKPKLLFPIWLFSVRILTTSYPISNPPKCFTKFLMPTLFFSINMLYFIDIFQPWVLFGFILPHPTLSYPVLPVLFFSVLSYPIPAYLLLCSLIQQPRKLQTVMKRWTDWWLCSWTFSFRVWRNYEKYTS